MSNSVTSPRESVPNTFAVDEVVPAEKPLWSEPLQDHLTKRFRRKLMLIPEAEKPVVNALRDELNARTSSSLGLAPEFRVSLGAELVNRCHPLIDAVGTAFSQHRPLTLSPDSIWLVIEQGFAHHVSMYAETLRPRLVRHTGKLELQTDIADLSLPAFQLAIQDFSSQIRESTDQVVHETLICDFSTTTPAIRTASEVVLMDCYSSYFTYGMRCVCGIPKITLTGTVDDWRRIRARIEVLETFGLNWWQARLRPILDQFVRTAEGRPSLEFWQAIYKPKQAYGTKTVTGWIADLFPYLNDPPHRRRNPILIDQQRRDWIIPVEKGVESARGPFEPGANSGIAPRSFPSGLASVPVKLSFPNRTNMDLDLVAGFLAVEQDPADLSLSPLIGWSVTEPKPAVPVLI